MAVNPLLLASSVYLRGLRTGYVMAGHSLFRRFFCAFLVWVILVGSGLGFLWASWDIYSTAAEHLLKLSADGTAPTLTTIGKTAAWLRVYKRHAR